MNSFIEIGKGLKTGKGLRITKMKLNNNNKSKKAMKKIWIISDMHLYHKNMINNHIRPSNYQQLIMDNLEKVVGENDILIDLGDITWTSKLDDRFLSLKCKKILVKGNHDKQSNFWYMSHGYDFACNSFTLSFAGKNILFTHKPIYLVSDLFDYNIHGHLHDQDNLTDFNYLISLERNGYKPELLDTIVNKLNKKEK